MADLIEERFGAHVRDLRKMRGWSQEDLAVRLTHAGLQTHQTQVGKTESGVRPIRLNEAALVAQVFGVRLVDLLAPEPHVDDPWGMGYANGFRDGHKACAESVRAFLDQPADGEQTGGGRD